MLEIAAVCLVITALLAYLNHRFIGLPIAIGMMAASLTLSLALVALDAAGITRGLRQYEETLLRAIDFSDVLMQGMLSMLLFAGALHVDLKQLKIYRWPVAGGIGCAGHDAVDPRGGLWDVGRAPVPQPRSAADPLPAVRRIDLADRSDRGDGHPQIGWRAKGAGIGDCRRVAVQRRGWGW